MRRSLRDFWSRHRTLLVSAIFILSSGAVYGVVVHFSGRKPPVATFQVQRGEFLDAVQFRGQLKAMKSVTITAPANAGDLQILKIAADGAPVKKGDVVVEFDPSKTRQDLAQDQSILKSAQAEIEQVRAQGRLTEEADTTAAMKAKYDVELAKLEASKSEVVSRIEGAEAKLKLADAEQSLRLAEAQLKSDIAINRATIDGKKNASRKADFDANRAATALAAMTLRAPSDGSISLLSVWHNGGESPFKAGERAWPGTPLAEQEPIDTFSFIRTIACARILIPKAKVRLSAGHLSLSEEAQTLAFLAGANSIFLGDKLLTTPNPEPDKDYRLFEKLGLVPAAMSAEEHSA